MLPTIPILAPPDIQIPAIVRPAEEKPKVITYEIIAGDTLESIASEHRTSVLRLFYKNPSIEHPDEIKVGQKLVIPAKNEKLKKREVPDIIKPLSARALDSPRISGGYSSSGNTYSYGFCTWAVKNWKPSIPNGWGNASNWLYAAQSMGWPTGTTPRVGAVAWEYNHVSYVIAVNGDNVTVREANYVGWNQVSERTAPASQFRYLY